MAVVTPDGRYLFFQSGRRGSGASRGLFWVDARVIEETRPGRKKGGTSEKSNNNYNNS
ncbi:MAG: hypothetical protein JW843_06500 [Candidatus Aminicenantes bacterium]|nr:hypothetical protein [Candidatus Aminicenantes bacterium]